MMRKLTLLGSLLVWCCCFAMDKELQKTEKSDGIQEHDLSFVCPLSYFQEKKISQKQELNHDELMNIISYSPKLWQDFEALKQAIKKIKHRKIEKKLEAYFNTTQKQLDTLELVIISLNDDSNILAKEAIDQHCKGQSALHRFVTTHFAHSETMTAHWNFVRIAMLRDLEKRLKRNTFDKRIAQCVEQSGPCIAGAGMGIGTVSLIGGIATWPALMLTIASGGCCGLMQSDCYDAMRPKRYWYKNDQDKTISALEHCIRRHEIHK